MSFFDLPSVEIVEAVVAVVFPEWDVAPARCVRAHNAAKHQHM